MSSSQPPFDPTLKFHTTLPPNPNWKPGQGCNNNNNDNQNRIPFKLIQPGKTKVDANSLYKIMLGGISPRPIALVGTYSEDQIPNLAPVSWYQTISHDPPLVMISFGGKRERIKDSEKNILRSKQFTISCSTEDFAESVNFSSINSPSLISEFTLTGLTPIQSRLINAPRVLESPFSMELELDHKHQWNNDQGDHTTTMIIGKVKLFHIRNDIIDQSGNGIDLEKLKPITRFAGSIYCRTTIGYNLTIPQWDQIKDDEMIKELIKKGPKQPSQDDIDQIAEQFP